MKVSEGKKVPDILLIFDDGGKKKLSHFKGQPLVVYFYRKDDTGGCTKEIQTFTEYKGKFNDLGVEIIGISPNSLEKHTKFI